MEAYENYVLAVANNSEASSRLLRLLLLYEWWSYITASSNKSYKAPKVAAKFDSAVPPPLAMAKQTLSYCLLSSRLVSSNVSMQCRCAFNFQFFLIFQNLDRGFDRFYGS
jgi:hypothetical protein